MEKDRKLTIPQVRQFKEAFDKYDYKNCGLVQTMYDLVKWNIQINPLISRQMGALIRALGFNPTNDELQVRNP